MTSPNPVRRGILDPWAASRSQRSKCPPASTWPAPMSGTAWRTCARKLPMSERGSKTSGSSSRIAGTKRSGRRPRKCKSERLTASSAPRQCWPPPGGAWTAARRLERSAAWVVRDQAEIDRAVLRAERELRRLPPVPGGLTERAAALRKQIAVAAARLAGIEEDLARVYDELAVRHPDLSGEHLFAADEARAAARLVRETGHQFTRTSRHGSHAGSHTAERPSSSPDLRERSRRRALIDRCA
jgi:hypothetical protein